MIGAVSREIVEQVAKNTFGTRVQVESMHKMGSLRKHDIVRRAASTRNLIYKIKLSGIPQWFVFRFHRGQEEDRYEQEVHNYQLLASTTGVCVPRIHGVDRSRKIVPTSYMVMDYLAGERWEYLAHPDNPETQAHEKEEIRRKMGRFYAQVHSVTKASEEADAEAKAMLRMLDRLESAVRKGHLAIDLKKIDQCRRAVEREPAFRNDHLCLCLVDTELFFAKAGREWGLAFLCDTEWVEYRDGYCDLSPVLGGPVALWELDRPLEFADASKAAALSFFRGYDELRPLDYEKLIRLPLYHHLGLWANVADAQNTPTKIGWIKKRKEPLITELVERIAAKAARADTAARRTTVLQGFSHSSLRNGQIVRPNRGGPGAGLSSAGSVPFEQHRTAAPNDRLVPTLRHGAVDTLILDKNFGAPGWRCAEDPSLVGAGGEPEACPVGPGAAETADLREEFTTLALQTGARVKFVEGSDELGRMGGVAALLRWKPDDLPASPVADEEGMDIATGCDSTL